MSRKRPIVCWFCQGCPKDDVCCSILNAHFNLRRYQWVLFGILAGVRYQLCPYELEVTLSFISLWDFLRHDLCHCSGITILKKIWFSRLMLGTGDYVFLFSLARVFFTEYLSFSSRDYPMGRVFLPLLLVLLTIL